MGGRLGTSSPLGEGERRTTAAQAHRGGRGGGRAAGGGRDHDGSGSCVRISTATGSAGNRSSKSYSCAYRTSGKFHGGGYVVNGARRTGLASKGQTCSKSRTQGTHSSLQRSHLGGNVAFHLAACSVERAKGTLLLTCQRTGTRRLRLCTFWQTAPSHGRLLPGGAPWHSRAISAGGGRPGRFCTRLLPGKRSPTCCPELRNYTKWSIHFDGLCSLRFVKRKEKDIGRLNFFPMLTFDVRIDSMQG